MKNLQSGFIGIPIFIAILLGIVMLGGGAYYVVHQQTPTQTTSEKLDAFQASTRNTSTSAQNPTPNQLTPSTSVVDNTANWKTFVNSRDGYSVKYPSEEIAGAPSTDCCSDLSQFGFEKSMSFMRYGGWADIYIFNGSSDKAIAAYKKVDGENRVYNSTENMVIGGKSGMVVSWTNKLDSSSHVSHGYFVEYQPGKTLYIGSSKEFVTTIKFLTSDTGGLIKFNAVAGTTFTLTVGQSATDGTGGITVKLDSISSGQYPMASALVISASSTFEAYVTNLQKTWYLTPDLYSGSSGSYLAWSAKYGDSAWPDLNSPTGTIILQVVSIDTSSKTATFKVRTQPFPHEVNSG